MRSPGPQVRLKVAAGTACVPELFKMFRQQTDA